MQPLKTVIALVERLHQTQYLLEENTAAGWCAIEQWSHLIPCINTPDFETH